MASFLKNMLGGAKADQKPVAADAGMSPKRALGRHETLLTFAGFADFANAPDPSPVSIVPSLASLAPNSAPTGAPAIPYTKWYRVWERTQLSDFYQEMIVIPFVLFILLVHVVGMRINKRKAREWATHHAPAMQFEYATVGFTNKPVASDTTLVPQEILLEQKADEFISYASGRNNVAFLDVKLYMAKRYNPFVIFGESLIGFLFESVPTTVERYEAIAYSFDNKESVLVPAKKDKPSPQSGNSSYDGFVFAIVNKKNLRRIREDRYDLSLTTTKDHPKLPVWTTVLSEGAEITDTLITNDLAKAIEDCGQLFEALIISDQPMERPIK